ncbi:MAG: hypothetical protein RL154_1448, partial [Pseudomonadota bacterium]
MSKLKPAFSLIEILVVIAIISGIYSLVFLPLSTKFKANSVEVTTFLSLTKRYCDAKDTLQSNDIPLYLECDSEYKSCGYYDLNASLVGKQFAINAKSPKDIFVIGKNGVFNKIWENSGKDGIKFLCP